jgi:hypothetical protein
MANQDTCFDIGTFKNSMDDLGLQFHSMYISNAFAFSMTGKVDCDHPEFFGKDSDKMVPYLLRFGETV